MKYKRGMYVKFVDNSGETQTGRIATVRVKDGRMRVEVDRNMRRIEKTDTEGKLTSVVYECDTSVFLVPRSLIKEAF